MVFFLFFFSILIMEKLAEITHGWRVDCYYETLRRVHFKRRPCTCKFLLFSFPPCPMKIRGKISDTKHLGGMWERRRTSWTVYKEILKKKLHFTYSDDAVFWYNKEYKMITWLNLHIIIKKKSWRWKKK
jgi:hypothetical protein